VTPPILGWVGGSPHARSHNNLNLNAMLELQAYTSTSVAQFVEHETVAEWAGPDAIVDFASMRNLKDLDKKVSIRITKGKDNFYVNCSGPLSDEVRAGKVGIAHILGFKIAQGPNEDGELRTFINLPTARLGGMVVKDTIIKTYTPASFSLEGTIQLG